ncbi:hypothetical protein BBJ28_00023302 [Nothophytophthora sp. Chile5]|nr:hypothetical protein BBJ28_00023302 [Nothophytophthora sp. Chile5]
MAVGERFRVAVSRDGICLALTLLEEHDGDPHLARQALAKEWTSERKTQEFATIFHRWFPLWKASGRRKDREEEETRVAFFDTAMAAWLQIAQDLRLFRRPSDVSGREDTEQKRLEPPDAAGLRRYDLQVWQRRIAPPPASVGDLCVHINALEGYLKMPHLSA